MPVAPLKDATLIATAEDGEAPDVTIVTCQRHLGHSNLVGDFDVSFLAGMMLCF